MIIVEHYLMVVVIIVLSLLVNENSMGYVSYMDVVIIIRKMIREILMVFNVIIHVVGEEMLIVAIIVFRTGVVVVMVSVLLVSIVIMSTSWRDRTLVTQCM